MTGERSYGIHRKKRDGKPIGNWIGWAYVGRGRTISKSMQTKDKMLAQERAAEWFAEMIIGGSAVSPTIATAWAEYSASDRFSRLAKNTRVNYDVSARHFIEWSDTTTRMSEITDADLRVFRDHLGRKLKPSSVNAVMSGALRALFWYAHHRGWVKNNPMSVISPLPVEQKPIDSQRMFTDDQMDRLLAIDDAPYAPALWAFYRYTGARRTEALRVLGGHVVDGWITIPGTKSVRAHRRVPILPQLKPHLPTVPAADPLFRVAATTTRERLYQHGSMVGVERANFSMFRRAYVTKMQNLLGPDYESVGRVWVGHSASSTSDLYYRGIDQVFERELAGRLAQGWG